MLVATANATVVAAVVHPIIVGCPVVTHHIFQIVDYSAVHPLVHAIHAAHVMCGGRGGNRSEPFAYQRR